MARPKTYENSAKWNLSVDQLTKDHCEELARELGVSSSQLIAKYIRAAWEERNRRAHYGNENARHPQKADAGLYAGEKGRTIVEHKPSRISSKRPSADELAAVRAVADYASRTQSAGAAKSA